MSSGHRLGRMGLIVMAAVFALVLTGPGAAAEGVTGRDRCSVTGWARGCAEVRFGWLPGFDDPATPDHLDRVGVLAIGPPRARNVLVLNPGTSAGASYFVPLAEDIVRATRGRWQVWAVERRENQLEDHSVLDLTKRGRVPSRRFFDYYLGWLADSDVTDHVEFVPDSAVPFARGWGMNVTIEDLHRVVSAAGARGRRVVLGGHSLGGSITTAYATWDFNGRPGGNGLAGLVYIDGGSGPVPISPDEARRALSDLAAGSPWLAFGGIDAPLTGIFAAVGSTLTGIDPDDPSIVQTFPLLPPSLKTPVPTTNEASFGFAVDADTSPPNLIAAQVNAGRLAETGDPRGWERAGEITPIQRYARMLSGGRLPGRDGTAWYHPLRLTIDARAVAAGNPNPAQDILDVKAVHGHDLSDKLRIYAFGASLGGQRVLDGARVLAGQSGIPDRNLTLVNRELTYTHNDPNSASPRNAFLKNLTPFLFKVAHAHRRHR